MKIKESDIGKFLRTKCECGHKQSIPLCTALCFANHRCEYCRRLNPPMIKNRAYLIYQKRRIIRILQGKSVPGRPGKLPKPIQWDVKRSVDKEGNTHFTWVEKPE